MSVITILGGTGTLAKAIVPILLEKEDVDRIRILSRGEHQQMWLKEKWDNPKLDFLIGDIRDYYRVLRATRGASLVFHFAAMKSVDKAEYDPDEAISINVSGTQNVIRACIENKISRAMFTSTDKAVEPLNIYGASKLCAEKLWIAGNIGKHDSRFSVIRYGNVIASNGSVVQRWKKKLEADGNIDVTDREMTRFWITPNNAAMAVWEASTRMVRGEIFIPKMKSSTMYELAKACVSTWGRGRLVDDCLRDVIVRPGEKTHETLVACSETKFVTTADKFLIRWPDAHLFPFPQQGELFAGKGFSSFDAERFSQDELVQMCKAATFE